MAFCSNCGQPITEGVKFCPNCGKATSVTTSSEHKEQRKTVYEGEVHKCPNCGEIFDSFITICPTCGYEIRGASASKAVREFALKLEQSTTDEQRIVLIRSYPIPNTKEDVFEFMIIASTNIANESKNVVLDAWMVKFEQCYKKASLLFNGDSDFSKIQSLYDEGLMHIAKLRSKKTTKSTLELVGRNITVCAGLVMVIVAAFVDITGGNPSMIELLAIIVLIVAAFSLRKRSASMVDFGVNALCGLATIGLSFLLENGSMLELGGGIVLVVIAINFVKGVITIKDH